MSRDPNSSAFDETLISGDDVTGHSERPTAEEVREEYAERERLEKRSAFSPFRLVMNSLGAVLAIGLVVAALALARGGCDVDLDWLRVSFGVQSDVLQIDAAHTLADLDGYSVTIELHAGDVVVLLDESIDAPVLEEKVFADTPEEAKQVARWIEVFEGEREAVIRYEANEDTPRSWNADLVLRVPASVGGLEIETRNGAVNVLGQSGRLKIDTGNGRVTVADHDGPADIETSNGRVEVARISGALDIETNNGRVTAALADNNGGPVHIDTSNGKVELTVGRAFAGLLRADTSNGKISWIASGDADGRGAGGGESRSLFGSEAELVFGGKENPESVIDTSNGSIRIISAEAPELVRGEK